MYDKDLVNNDLKLHDAVDTLRYKRDFRRNNPDYFEGDGLIIFTGSQGTGKTLSAVRYSCDLLRNYPKAKFVTNILIKDYPIVTFNEFLRDNYGKLVAGNLYKLSDIAQRRLIEDYRTLNRVFPFNNSDDLMRYNNRAELFP